MWVTMWESIRLFGTWTLRGMGLGSFSTVFSGFASDAGYYVFQDPKQNFGT